MTKNVFNFNGQDLRTITINGEPWFHATDVCKQLGLSTYAGTSNQLKHLSKDERFLCNRTTLGSSEGQEEFLGKAHQLNAVNESGLYKLTMLSRKPEAIAFQNWVTKEVLPSIRKTGGYLLNEAARPTAHADTKVAMPLPEGFAQMFQMLFAPVMKPLEDLIVTQGDRIAAQGAIILSMQAHLEKLASGEEPSDVWMNGDLTRDMSDGHLKNAIKWAKANRVSYDVLTKEQARRIRLKKRKAA